MKGIEKNSLLIVILAIGLTGIWLMKQPESKLKFIGIALLIASLVAALKLKER